MLNPDDFKRAIQAVDALGATLAVLVKAAELAKDPNTDLPAICELLRNDGPLAADIIRISNSSYYAPATFHSNLTSAVNMIGLREVNRVVNLSLARQMFARDLASYGVSANDYWSDSIAAALVMEALAKHSGLNLEDAYTIGILHAIGRVLINRVIEEHGFTIYWDGHQPIQDWERGSVGFDYAEAGAMLLEHWCFPTPTCDIIRWQLNPEKAVEQVSLLGSLQFAQRLLALTGLDFENTGWQFPETDPFVRAAGLTAERISQYISACRDDFQCILQSVDLG
jgi:HD-like signal output (HDOD) protein